MNSKIILRNIVLVLMSSTSQAFAAGGREDHSGLLVWAFLGFCALIVAAQVVPALLVLFGIAKGVAPQGVPAHQAAHE